MNNRALEEKRARLGIVECMNHDLLEPYPVLYEKPGMSYRGRKECEICDSVIMITRDLSIKLLLQVTWWHTSNLQSC